MTFLHKIEPGPADKSYGIHVAKIAGLPQPLLSRAKLILSELENSSTQHVLEAPIKEAEQLGLFGQSDELVTAVKQIDVMNLTPMDAINQLYELKKLV